jgi:hypothetical protein
MQENNQWLFDNELDLYQYWKEESRNLYRKSIGWLAVTAVMLILWALVIPLALGAAAATFVLSIRYFVRWIKW